MKSDLFGDLLKTTRKERDSKSNLNGLDLLGVGLKDPDHTGTISMENSK
jgi:hypothetical protein